MEVTRRAFICAVGAVALAGCSQREPEKQGSAASTKVERKDASEPKNLEIKESGYWFDQYGNGNFATIVENPNKHYAVQYAELRVTGKDDAGKVVGTETHYLTLMFAYGKTALCGTSFINGATSLEFSLTNAKKQWEREDTTMAEYDKKVYAQNLNETVDEYGMTTIAGEVVSEAKGEFEGAAVNIVLRDDSGSVVGGAQSVVGTLPVGTTAFSAGSLFDVPAHAKIEAYVDCGSAQS